MTYFRTLLSLMAAAWIHAGATGAAAMGSGAVETGDRVDGVQVISRLSVDGLPTGRHNFYFRASWQNTGQPILVPVIVVKGAKPGKRLMLAAAVHGDELNGIAVIHKLVAKLDPAALRGTVVAIPGLNQPAIITNNRRFPVSSGGGSLEDLNRNFPGAKDNAGSTAGRFVGALWDSLILPNTDFAIDLHTQTRGTAYPLFVFADFGNSTAQSMAFMLGPDMIKNDPGQAGTLETSLMKEGIPTVTLEVGAPKQFQADLIARAVGGIENVMRQNAMLDGEVAKPTVKPIVGSSYTNVYADRGGVAVLHVGLMDAVKRGQHVATLYDAFGREIGRYKAPHDGWVLAVATDPMREPGSMLLRILQ